MTLSPKQTKFRLYVETVDFEDFTKLSDLFKSHQNLVQGELTTKFESAFSTWLGRKYSIFCNSGSSANLLMYYALLISGRLKNKKVIVPSAGWSTCIAPAIQLGFEPIMCDIDTETFSLNLEHLDDLLAQNNPHAVFVPQIFGIPHKMEKLMALRKKYDFILLEDVCESIGSERKNVKLGTFGDMASFSFHFGQQMTTLQGGMVVTDDPVFYNLLLMLRSGGTSSALEPNMRKALMTHYEIDDFDTPDIFFEPAFNLCSTDFNAFVGLGQLQKLEWEISRRNENYYLYKEILNGKCRFQICDDPEALLSNLHFVLICKDESERRSVETTLSEQGIETRIFSSAHLGKHPFWTNRYGKIELQFAEKLFKGGLLLPNHPLLLPEDIHRICDLVLKSLKK